MRFGRQLDVCGRPVTFHAIATDNTMCDTMVIAEYQISNVIKTYMKNMKTRMTPVATTEDSVLISEEGMKRVLFDRIGEEMVSRSKKHFRDSLELIGSE
jgi:hypothetical protein